MEILTEAKEGHQNLASTLLQESMEQAGKYYCKHVKMSAKPDIATYWVH